MFKKIFKTDIEEVEKEREEELAELLEKREEKFEEKAPAKNIDEEILNFLSEELIAIEPADRLQKANNLNASPLCILRTENEPLSVWYRLPVRGESGVMHMPDFVIFRGKHRMSPREKNPDIIVECRELRDNMSNRTDPRIVNDVIGCSLDTLPSLTILVTNRDLSEYAQRLANSYGIGIISLETGNAKRDLIKLVTSEDHMTRDKMSALLPKKIDRIGTLNRLQKKITAGEIAKSSLKEKILKALSAKASIVPELSSTLGIRDEHILNQLYILQKEGKVEIRKQGQDYKHDEWAFVRSS